MASMTRKNNSNQKEGAINESSQFTIAARIEVGYERRTMNKIHQLKRVVKTEFLLLRWW